LKLNIGGRDTKIDGFLCVDVHPEADIKCDLSKLDGIDDGSVEEIYASHCLEHFSHTNTLGVLREWHRVLKPGGKMYVGVPDFDAAVTVYKKIGLSDFIRNLLWGDQGYGEAYHYTSFTFPTLAGACASVGFSDVKRIKEMPYGLLDCSTLQDNIMNIPLSLNIEARK